jgi:hypothetical protein
VLRQAHDKMAAQAHELTKFAARTSGGGASVTPPPPSSIPAKVPDGCPASSQTNSPGSTPVGGNHHHVARAETGGSPGANGGGSGGESSTSDESGGTPYGVASRVSKCYTPAAPNTGRSQDVSIRQALDEAASAPSMLGRKLLKHG